MRYLLSLIRIFQQYINNKIFLSHVIIALIFSRADGGAGAGDARPWERGTRAQPKTISHLNPFSVHGWVPSVPALWSKRKRPSRPGHYSRLPACCRLRPHRVADGAACHRRIRYGLSYVSTTAVIVSAVPLPLCCSFSVSFVRSLVRSFARSLAHSSRHDAAANTSNRNRSCSRIR